MGMRIAITAGLLLVLFKGGHINMHCVEEIKNGIYWMGCNDFRTELFERIFPIPEA